MKFYKNIIFFITVITLIVIALNVFFYTSFYNQQLKTHGLILSRQVKYTGNQVEDNINNLKNDLNFYFNKYDFYQLFNDKNLQSEPIRKIRQFFIKYNDLISSIEITDKKGNTFIFDGNTENYFNKTYLENLKNKFLLKNAVNYDSTKNLIYTSILKDGNDVIANIKVKVELITYFEILFKQYHVNHQYFQSLANNEGEVIFQNLTTSIIFYRDKLLIKKSINENFEDLINQNVSYNNNKEDIISGIYPINIFGYKFGLIFSEKKSSIYDIVLRKTGLISFFTILTFIVILVIFQNLVKTLKQNEIVLKQRNLDLEQLTFSASHHLQEPLRKTFIFSDRLSSKLNVETNKQELEILRKIQGFSHNMRQMLNSLLFYSEINLKGNKFEIINLNNVIQSIIKEKSTYLSEENIIISNLPEITGDIKQIKILFTQIIDNCINFAKKDNILKIEIFQGEKNKNYHLIKIKDNGVGFDKKYNELIFQPFQQLTPVEGSNRNGIGLTLASKIIEKHKGKIYAEGNLNEGCIITIEFFKKLKNG